MPGIFRPDYRLPRQRSRWIPTVPTAGGPVVINVDTPGVITWTGSSVTLAYKEVVTAGAITWTGSSVPLAYKVIPTAGVITWTGSAITLKTTVVVTGGVVTWTGQSITLAYKIIPTAGVITWTGQTIVLRYVVVIQPGIITWTGGTVSAFSGDQGAPVKGPTRKVSLAGDDVDTEELEEAIRAVMIGAGQNSLQEV